MTMRLPFCLFLFLLGSLTGCLNLDPTPDPTRYYSLSPRDFVAMSSGLVEVEVSQLPYYAETKRIPIRIGEVEISYLEFDRWTGPVDVMVAARIRERLDPWAAEAKAGHWHVTLEVLACEGVDTGEVRFVADYELRQVGEPDPIATGRFIDSAPWEPEKGAVALAERLGLLVDALGERLATFLSDGNFPKQGTSE